MNLELFNQLADLAAKLVYKWSTDAQKLYSRDFIQNNNLCMMLDQPQFIPSTFAVHYDCLDKFVGVEINPALNPYRYSDLIYEVYKMCLYIVFRMDRVHIDDPASFRLVIEDKKIVANSYNGILPGAPEPIIPKKVCMSSIHKIPSYTHCRSVDPLCAMHQNTMIHCTFFGYYHCGQIK